MWEVEGPHSRSGTGLSSLLVSLPVAFGKLPSGPGKASDWSRVMQKYDVRLRVATSSCRQDILVQGPVCSHQAHPLSFLSMPHEVKSLPGIPSSPAPAVATFSQPPSQPQASQTLAPLAVQTAPQVRATPGSRTQQWAEARHGTTTTERRWDLETHEAGQGRGCGLREGVPF